MSCEVGVGLDGLVLGEDILALEGNLPDLVDLADVGNEPVVGVAEGGNGASLSGVECSALGVPVPLDDDCLKEWWDGGLPPGRR